MEILQRGNVEFGSQATLDLLSVNGLVDLDTVFNYGEVIHRRYKAKDVSVAMLHDGDQTIRVFIKKQWKHSRLIPQMHTFLSGKAFWSYPLCEWWGLLRFREIGLNTAEPLALYRHHWHPYRAAIITREVPGEVSLFQMIENGMLGHLDASVLTRLGDAIVTVIERIHNSGLCWRSMAIKHFHPTLQEDGSWLIWLIDCEGVHDRATPHYIERERRSVVNQIRKAGREGTLTELFAKSIERRLFDSSL